MRVITGMYGSEVSDSTDCLNTGSTPLLPTGSITHLAVARLKSRG